MALLAVGSDGSGAKALLASNFPDVFHCLAAVVVKRNEITSLFPNNCFISLQVTKGSFDDIYHCSRLSSIVVVKGTNRLIVIDKEAFVPFGGLRRWRAHLARHVFKTHRLGPHITRESLIFIICLQNLEHQMADLDGVNPGDPLPEAGQAGNVGLLVTIGEHDLPDGAPARDKYSVATFILEIIRLHRSTPVHAWPRTTHSMLWSLGLELAGTFRAGQWPLTDPGQSTSLLTTPQVDLILSIAEFAVRFHREIPSTPAPGLPPAPAHGVPRDPGTVDSSAVELSVENNRVVLRKTKTDTDLGPYSSDVNLWYHGDGTHAALFVGEVNHTRNKRIVYSLKSNPNLDALMFARLAQLADMRFTGCKTAMDAVVGRLSGITYARRDKVHAVLTTGMFDSLTTFAQYPVMEDSLSFESVLAMLVQLDKTYEKVYGPVYENRDTIRSLVDFQLHTWYNELLSLPRLATLSESRRHHVAAKAVMKRFDSAMIAWQNNAMFTLRAHYGHSFQEPEAASQHKAKDGQGGPDEGSTAITSGVTTSAVVPCCPRSIPLPDLKQFLLMGMSVLETLDTVTAEEATLARGGSASKAAGGPSQSFPMAQPSFTSGGPGSGQRRAGQHKRDYPTSSGAGPSFHSGAGHSDPAQGRLKSESPILEIKPGENIPSWMSEWLETLNRSEWFEAQVWRQPLVWGLRYQGKPVCAYELSHFKFGRHCTSYMCKSRRSHLVVEGGRWTIVPPRPGPQDVQTSVPAPAEPTVATAAMAEAKSAVVSPAPTKKHASSSK